MTSPAHRSTRPLSTRANQPVIVGQLLNGGDRWGARWREDSPSPDGSVKRIRKWDVIAPKKGASRETAEQVLAGQLRKIDGADQNKALVTRGRFHWSEACESCRIVFSLRSLPAWCGEVTKPGNSGNKRYKSRQNETKVYLACCNVLSGRCNLNV